LGDTLNDDVAELRRYLDSLGTGSLKDLGFNPKLLARCWRQLKVTDTTEMSPDKLRHRVRNPSWDPPILEFWIERHRPRKRRRGRSGAFPQIHRWVVNLDKLTARVVKRARPLNVKPLATKVVELMKARAEHPWLKWNSHRRTARVLVGKIIPDELVYRRTLAGRRLRFWMELKRQAKEAGIARINRKRYRVVPKHPLAPAAGQSPTAASGESMAAQSVSRPGGGAPSAEAPSGGAPRPENMTLNSPKP
jgi:hypothetical protein